MAVPYAIRTVTPNETEPAWPKVYDLFATNFDDGYIQQMGFRYTDIDVDHIDDILRIGETVNAGPFSDCIDNWREASLAVRNRSNSVACILASTTCELFLRNVLTFLLWEEGRDPREASRILCGDARYSQSITKLISREFPPRLGGSWQLKGDGLIAHVHQNVFQLRNRVVHGGYTPNNQESEKAVDAYKELNDWIIQRLNTRKDRYKLAALMLSVNPQYELDKQRIQQLDDLMLDQTIPITIRDNFICYKREVERYMQNRDLRNGGAFSGELENTDVAILAFPNGKVQWWLRDRENGVACLAKRPQLNPFQINTVKDVRRYVKKEGVLHTGAMPMLIRGVHAVPLEDPPVWYPDYQVWPLCRADRFPACPIPVQPTQPDLR